MERMICLFEGKKLTRFAKLSLEVFFLCFMGSSKLAFLVLQTGSPSAESINQVSEKKKYVTGFIRRVGASAGNRLILSDRLHSVKLGKTKDSRAFWT